ncbi:hypothetical protein [Yersinia vastinensis]
MDLLFRSNTSRGNGGAIYVGTDIPTTG